MTGWFLDSPSHLSTQTSSSYQLCDLLVYKEEPNVVLSSDKSSLGWLGYLKPLVLDAASSQLDPLSSFCFSFLHCLLLCVPSSSQDSGSSVSRGSLCLFLTNRLTECVFCLCSWLKSTRFHVCLVPLPPSSNHLLQPHLEFPGSKSSSARREWPHVLL